MVAYSFKPSFRAPIFAREKQGTIRMPRKRTTVVGDPLTLLSGPRMKPDRWGSAQCVETHQVRLDFGSDRIVLDDAIVIDGDEELNAFAIRDGFRPRPHLAAAASPWDLMSRWWALTHPEHKVFSGDWIVWGDTFQPHQGA